MIQPDIQQKLFSILERKNAELSEYSLGFPPEETPYNLSRNFPGYEDYALELGSGWGEFVLHEAGKNPGIFYVAIEKKKKRVLRAIRRQKELGLANIRWLILDINWFFANLFCQEQFSRVIINFPDPWPKRRHHKHRFFSASFLGELTRITKKGGILEFATDFYPYLEEVFWYLEGNPAWHNKYGRGVILPHVEGRFVSYYEEQARRAGLATFFLFYQRV
ncbi:MAG: hypothetical protein RML34_10305 [Leptospiraceae bacterium]|nr:hypothetical protein [Leptospiraceae bacterium]